jgi:hypothetical protein
MVEPLVLQMASTRDRCLRAYRIAISVSIDSPDWEIAISSVDRSRIGSRYRNSLATSTSQGMRVQCSIAYLAIMPAWYEVPQAMMMILSTSRSSWSDSRISSRVSMPSASIRPSSVSATACGCSAISLSMK